MESSLIRDPRILEALEACRPGSDDLMDPAMEPLARQIGVFPELGTLYERLQRTDQALAEAFWRVGVPLGLPARILSRLAAAPDPSGPLLSMPLPGPSLGVADVGRGGAASLALQRMSADMPTLREGMPPRQDVLPRVAGRPSRLRRGWLYAAGALAVAASILVAVFLNSSKPPGLSTEGVLNEAITFFNRDVRDTGMPLSSGPAPPARYPLSQALPTRNCQVRWRWIDGFLDSRGVAYDITGPGGIRATVYVVKLHLPGLGASPSGVPMLATGQRATAVWQEGDLLYVLVVEGESREYERFFWDLASGPVT